MIHVDIIPSMPKCLHVQDHLNEKPIRQNERRNDKLLLNYTEI
jgi:hypothetical protein